MIGSLFAAHEVLLGETVELDGKQYKEYFGSASEFQKANIKIRKCFVEHKGSLMDTVRNATRFTKLNFICRWKRLEIITYCRLCYC